MKRIYILRVVLFITILIVPIMTMNLKSNQVSEIDNKKLIEASEILPDNFTAGVENFIEDRIGFRTTMINSYTKSMDFLFNYMVHPNYQYGEDGYVFSKLYKESFDSEYQDIYSDFILKLQNYCNNRNIDFLYAVEPSKTTVYSDYLPAGVDYKNFNLNYFLNLLSKKDINFVYTGDVLINAKDKYQVFDKKYDANHWNETGAIIGISTILNTLNLMDSSINKFDINNYTIDTNINTTLPASYFSINEESTTYTLKYDNSKSIDTFTNKIKLSEYYRNFAYYVNEANPSAPKVLVFAGSYFNGKHKFLTESFSEFILVHNYFNVLDFDYYINLFNPDVVLFESTEYTHTSNYFDMNSMNESSYNKNITSYINLLNTQFASIDGDLTISDNGAVTDFNMPLTSNNTLYSYALIGDRILDCKTIIDDTDKQYIQFSISSSELENLNSFTVYTISNDEKEYSEIKVNL